MATLVWFKASLICWFIYMLQHPVTKFFTWMGTFEMDQQNNAAQVNSKSMYLVLRYVFLLFNLVKLRRIKQTFLHFSLQHNSLFNDNTIMRSVISDLFCLYSIFI
jgi:hypothetical protein